MGVQLRKKEISKGRQSLYLDLYQDGKRSYEFLELYLTGERTHDKEATRLAEMVRSRRELELMAGTYDLVTTFSQRIKLVDYAKEVALKHGEKTMWTRAYSYLEKHSGTILLKNVTGPWLKGYQAFLLTSGLSQNTASQYFNILSATLNSAVAEKLIPSNPSAEIKGIKYTPPSRNTLTPEDLSTLENTPIMGESGVGGRFKRAFLFACHTGLRISDIKSLTWGHVRGDLIEKVQVKTKVKVIIPLNQSASIYLGKRPADASHEDFIFSLLETDPNQYIGPWAKKAGLPFKVNFHLSRHTFATLLLESGADPLTIQRLMGQLKIDMTLIYAQSSMKMKKKAVQGLEE